MGKSLAEIRISSGYESQDSLAEAVKCTRSAVAKWENGLSYPATQKLPLLARILGVSEGEIIKAITESKKTDSG